MQRFLFYDINTLTVSAGDSKRMERGRTKRGVKHIHRERQRGREREEGTKERKGLLLLRRHFFDLLKPARPLTPSLATILWRRSMRECETAVITACMVKRAADEGQHH